MSQYLPKDGFKWSEKNLSVPAVLKRLEETPADSCKGMILEVDVSYPTQLHDNHNDLPYLPDKKIPTGSKFPKLLATLENKKKYIVHYKSLKQALQAGLVLEKVHRNIEFNQSPWLASYISLNTRMRAMAKNTFEKDFYKLMNNSVFGKTMENVRLRLKMELTSSEARYRKLVNLPNHKGTTIYGDNLCAVHLHKDDLVFDKPMYIGFAVLDISKTLMYDFHYGTMKALYGENIELLYMDTDSLIYLVKTKNFYENMEHNRGFLEKLDTSNYLVNHPCYRIERCKIPGTFTDETGGEFISAHVALRSKAYGFIQNKTW
ncbi:uncharacterized protein LOC126898643 isoform X2 [Daktulosphaira vitifoliae]|uniref:uncharacterized protein LOC126898643 isoform X2 n=1 Tax=Daktulosphaira vitifoliae TaxID=58002 RepID=UPI0021AA5957|nr:uncharacterized protein LOC126898643 isoform X2 [Daktulosphaira vitifoliae]